MLHTNNFVLAIRDQNRNILREYEGKVYLPFHQEYSLFLKNTNNVRCKCSVKIDGTDVLGGSDLIINPNDCMNLERFLCDGDLSRGRKFKFVPANDAAVADPTSADNGWVEVTFWKEHVMPTIWVNNSSPVRFYGSGSSGTYTTSCNSVFMCDMNSVKCSNSNIGATVEGNVSNQGFVNVSGFTTEPLSTVLRIQLLGNKQSITAHDTKKVHCTSCGRKVKFNDNFCGSCGTKV